MFREFSSRILWQGGSLLQKKHKSSREIVAFRSFDKSFRAPSFWIAICALLVFNTVAGAKSSAAQVNTCHKELGFLTVMVPANSESQVFIQHDGLPGESVTINSVSFLFNPAPAPLPAASVINIQQPGEGQGGVNVKFNAKDVPVGCYELRVLVNGTTLIPVRRLFDAFGEDCANGFTLEGNFCVGCEHPFETQIGQQCSFKEGTSEGLDILVTSPPQLQVGAAFSEEQGTISPQTTASSDPNNPAMAQVPLGRAIIVASFDAQGQPASATFSVSGQNVTQEGLDPKALFHDFAIFQYGSRPDPSQASFQPVHLGDVLLTITPTDSSLPIGYIKLVIENPASLGTEHSEVDALIYPLAHKTGIMPQYIKAQIRKESGNKFDPLAYRYEPLSPWVGDFGSISRFGTPQDPSLGNLRTQPPYSNYILATAPDFLAPDGLRRGPNLVPADVAPRKIYNICCDTSGNPRPLSPSDLPQAGDQLVSFLNIFFANVDSQRWCTINLQACGEVIDQLHDLASVSFTAQTSVASSYGLLQMTYVNAISRLHWKGVAGGGQNPSFLFDTPENLKIGGGSIGLATEDIRRTYLQLHKPDALAPNFDALSDLNDTFVDTWTFYNNSKDKTQQYGFSVLSSVDSYLPTATSAIF